ncbi:MAG: cell division protein ZipA [Gammaproteobacteria bacterium]|nr:cell division protein ZipA [Gammaproteobacteria bacterium]
MDTLRIILIILGIVVIIGIYLWEKSHKDDLPERDSSSDPDMGADEEDAPSLVITTQTKYNEDDLASELADLNFFMGDRVADDSGADEIFNEIRIQADSGDDLPDDAVDAQPQVIDEQVETENVEPEEVKQDDSPPVSEHIIVLHVMVDKEHEINGEDLQKVTASSGLEFGDMNIFHYRNVGLSGETKTLFSLVNLFEPGYFEPEKMDTFLTRGISLFATLKNDGSDLNTFDTMLVITRQIAKQLGGEVLGSDKTPLTDTAVEEIIQKLKAAV